MVRARWPPAPIPATVTVSRVRSPRPTGPWSWPPWPSGPSTITNGLEARDTAADARRAARARRTDHRGPATAGRSPRRREFTAGGTIDCGLAGTVMRFVPPIAALADGPVAFDGDEQAYGRPMGRSSARWPPRGPDRRRRQGTLPVHRAPAVRTVRGGAVTIDASASSQFVSGLLLAGARYAGGPRPAARRTPGALAAAHRDDRGDAAGARRDGRRLGAEPLGGRPGTDRRQRRGASSPTCPTPPRSWPPRRSPAARSPSRTGRR